MCVAELEQGAGKTFDKSEVLLEKAAMAAGWVPHPEGLAQLLQLLRDSSVANPQLQQSVHQVLTCPACLTFVDFRLRGVC